MQSSDAELLKSPHYAGFWIRVLAQIIDGLIISLFIVFLSDSSRMAMILSQLVSSAIFYGYIFYFYTKYGQTLGKMLMKIKVVHLDGSPIHASTVTRRKMVDIGLEVFRYTATVTVLLAMSDSEFLSLPAKNRGAELLSSNRVIGATLFIAAVWSAVDCLTVVFNHQKRAVHDYIAGTVVIRLPKSDPASASVPAPASVTDA